MIIYLTRDINGWMDDEAQLWDKKPKLSKKGKWEGQDDGYLGCGGLAYIKKKYKLQLEKGDISLLNININDNFGISYAIWKRNQPLCAEEDDCFYDLAPRYGD